MNQNRNERRSGIGFIAINKFGEQDVLFAKGFNYMVQESNVLIDAKKFNLEFLKTQGFLISKTFLSNKVLFCKRIEELENIF